MEVKLDKRYPVAAGVAQAWAVLADIRAVAACMPGAQITGQSDDTHYSGVVRSRVGPAVMTFHGDIEVLALDVAARSVRLLGKGADKAGSSASMNLTATVEPGDAPGTSVLGGQAVISVNGKLSQFGSRLLVPVADMMLGQFADNFRAAAAAAAAAASVEAAATESVASHAADIPTAADAAVESPTAAGTAVDSRPGGSAQSVASPSRVFGGAAPSSPPAMPAAAPEINAFALLRGLLRRWLGGLFGRPRDPR